MKKVSNILIHCSAALTIKPKQVKSYDFTDKPPVPGDVVYGEIQRLGQHSSLENVSGRIHMTHNGSKGLFVFGNRYAPDYFEGFVPESLTRHIDLLARSGVVGEVKTKNALVKDPTRVKVLGYALDENGEVLNTRNHSLVKPRATTKKPKRAKLVLVVGTAMNSGKSMAAASCCWALSSMGYDVRGSKITGTASLQDILHMNDAGAYPYLDFTHLGHPSTYMLPEEDLLDIFNKIDLKHCNNASNYWVAEISDGIGQRETAILLNSEDVKSRIDTLIFAAGDAFGAIGGLKVLKERFGLEPDAISGVCSSSPLHIRELESHTSIPVFNSAAPDLKLLADVLLKR
ncbi:MAG: hypothetical protein QNK90_11480 [Opitutaceae bacterium]|tara:strand:+ start:493 stop:1524 length:1032 start_codon:yes stop_codon:yes gene_type:complete